MAISSDNFGPKAHTDREYEAELAGVRKQLLKMAGQVEAMIAASVKALSTQDIDLARKTIEADAKVNLTEMETDELCIRILAKRQPVASDLRLISLAFKMVTDLERIGDLAVNICERAIDLAHEPSVRSYEDIHTMADLVQSMVRDAIDGFVQGDAQMAQSVIDRDDEVDVLYNRVFEDIVAVMCQDPANVRRSIHYQSVAKWLERMADHATNVAEQVIFVLRGKDVRHVGKLG
jgi:phosphate transport system protein